MGLLDGKVVVVTGSGGGLGREYAKALAAEGARVLVNDLGGAVDGTGSGTTMAEQVVEEIRSKGGEAVPNYDSVATMDGAEGIFRAAIDSFGQVDILVNNAGILRDRSFHNMTEQEWDAVIGSPPEGDLLHDQTRLRSHETAS